MDLFGPPNIDRLKTERNLKRLLKILKNHGKAKVRTDVILALGEIGDQKAVPSIIDRLYTGTDFEREAAIEALGKIGGEHAVNALLDRLMNRHIEDSYRKKIISALRGSTDERVIEAIGETIQIADVTYPTQVLAIRALADSGPAACKPLLQILHSREHFGLCTEAAMALERSGWPPDEGIDAAAYYFFKKDWEQCVNIGTPVVELLIWVIQNRRISLETRKQAVEALGRIDDPRIQVFFKDRLVHFKDSEDVDLAATIVQALDRGDRRPDDPEAAVIYDVIKGDWKACANNATLAVKTIFRLLRISSLVKERRSDRWEYEHELSSGLKKIGFPAVEPLMMILRNPEYNSDEREIAAYYLGEISSSEAVEALITALKEESPSAAHALGKIKDPRAIRPLIEALSVQSICARAAMALWEIGDRQAIKPILGALRKGICPENERSRMLDAVYGLGGEKALAEFWKEFLRYQDEHKASLYKTFGSRCDL